MNLTYCIVISEYKSPYTEPFLLRKDEILLIGNKESEWPGWIWMEKKDGYQEII
jgi:hypothetical protein